ncbi:hypothetical protein FRB99_001192 [Tulasnella sp. 403]|nr:hypothetical protein FRB99_001192 [Tulasnella sp. 403]
MTPNDAHIISASYDNSIRAWCPSLKNDKGKVLHKTKERISCLAVSPTADVMAISLSNLRNELLDTNTGDLIAILERPTNVWTLQFSPDGQRIYGGCSNGSICYWDVSDLLLIKEKKSVPYLEIKGGRIRSEG